MLVKDSGAIRWNRMSRRLNVCILMVRCSLARHGPRPNCLIRIWPRAIGWCLRFIGPRCICMLSGIFLGTLQIGGLATLDHKAISSSQNSTVATTTSRPLNGRRTSFTCKKGGMARLRLITVIQDRKVNGKSRCHRSMINRTSWVLKNGTTAIASTQAWTQKEAFNWKAEIVT